MAQIIQTAMFLNWHRDLRDRTRAVSPLVAAHDASLIDSTRLSEDEVLKKIEDLVNQKLVAASEPRSRAL